MVQGPVPFQFEFFFVKKIALLGKKSLTNTVKTRKFGT